MRQAIPARCKCTKASDTVGRCSLCKTAHRDHIGGLLRWAEISFFLAFAIVTSLHISHLCVSQEMATGSTRSPDGFNQRNESCPLRPSLCSESSPIVAGSTFLALDWLSTTFSPIPSSWPSEVVYTGPNALLEGDFPTLCYSFLGSQGGVGFVSNSGKYRISRFTLDNSILDPATPSLFYPKEGALWGLYEGTLPNKLRNATTSFVTDHATYVLIGHFCFDPQLGSVQTFPIDDDIVATPSMEFSVLYLEVSSNWGGSHTCLCRFRLHRSRFT